jgi:hypothetical protein
MGWTNYGRSQWSIGEYTDANNQEDDLAIITQDNGFGYRKDDHGSTQLDATPLQLGLDVVADGIIERSNDVDVFVFTLDVESDVSLTISPDNLAPNLDVYAALSDASGTELATSNPPQALDAKIEIHLLEGDYYLSVDGTGYDDGDSDGYSDYGSLGYYQVESWVEQNILEPERKGACGCSAGSSVPWPAWPLLLIVLARRRETNSGPIGAL